MKDSVLIMGSTLFHKKLSGFDYQNGLYYYNVGEGPHRNWEDYVKFGFISGGQAPRFRDAMLGFEAGDVVAAYLKSHGFVGVGRITQKARPVREVYINSGPLLQLELKCPQIVENSDDPDKSEYVCLVDWISVRKRSEAYWKARKGLFTSQLVRTSLEAQPSTVAFLEEEFAVGFQELMV